MPAQRGVIASGFSGTVWSGKIDQLSAQKMSLKKVEFSVNPLAMLTGGLSVTLDIPEGDLIGDLSLKVSGMDKPDLLIKDANLKLAAKKIEDYIPFKGIILNGEIVSKNLLVDIESQKPKALSGDVSWKKSSIGYAGQQWDLGIFSARFTTDDKTGVISGKFLKTKNKLGLEGKVSVTPDGMLEFIGHIATDIDQNIYSTLALFNNGKPAGGKLPIKFKQKVF